MAKDRGFVTTSYHDNALITAWNKNVKRGDCVVVLGDVFWTDFPHITAIWDRLNGSKILVKGNHDHRWLNKNKNIKWQRIYEHNYKVEGGKQYVVGCHYPMRSWNKKVHGSIHVHGHAHGKIPSHWRMIDVCPENAKLMFDEWRPFRLEEIIYLTQDKRRFPDDYNNKQNSRTNKDEQGR